MLEQPQRHRDTEKTQSQPPTSQPRRHEDTKTSKNLLDRPARPALSESAGLASRVDQTSAFEQVRTRRDRRAASASAAVKHGGDESLRSEQTGFAPGADDHWIAGVAAAPLRATSPTQVSPPLCLCVFAPLRFFLCAPLRVSVPLWFVRYLGSSKALQSRT